MNKYIIIAVVFVVGIVLAWFLLQDKKPQTEDLIGETYEQTATTEEIEKLTPPEEEATINNLENKKIMKATLNTSKGDIQIEFYADEAPKTVENFTKLANSKFYDGVKFHRVIKGFMIQTGDPLSKDESKASLWGTGGPGYKFADEIDPSSDLYTKVGYKKGVVAMANSGPNTNGSQFFIMHTDTPLPPAYTIFGKVVGGQEVVDQIALVSTGPNDRPTDAVVIKSIKVE